MTVLHGLSRLALAGVVCGALTVAPVGLLGVIGAITSAPGSRSPFGWWIALSLVCVPVAALGHAIGLLVFGLPLLWVWPAAFKRGAARGIGATAIGGIVVLLPSLALGGRLGDGVAVGFLTFCGMISGAVWWWLNFDAAPDSMFLPATENDLH